LPLAQYLGIVSTVISISAISRERTKGNGISREWAREWVKPALSRQGAKKDKKWFLWEDDDAAKKIVAFDQPKTFNIISL